MHSLSTFPSEYESTSLIVGYGLDVFFCKLAPEKAYDRLDDTNIPLLVLGLLAIMVCAKCNNI